MPKPDLALANIFAATCQGPIRFTQNDSIIGGRWPFFGSKYGKSIQLALFVLLPLFFFVSGILWWRYAVIQRAGLADDELAN